MRGEQVLQEDRVRDADRLQVLHRALQLATVERLVALELDLADFDLGSFFDDEGQRHGGRRNGPHFRLHGGELVAVRRLQLLDHDFGVLHLGRIVLAFLGEADLLFLELVQNVALRNRTQAGVLDFADGRLLFNVDVDDPAFG